MFDIGFAELLLISVMALLVLGPERLPVAVKTVALWVGRFKRSWTNLRKEIEKEIGADEVRQQLHNEAILKDLFTSVHAHARAVHAWLILLRLGLRANRPPLCSSCACVRISLCTDTLGGACSL